MAVRSFARKTKQPCIFDLSILQRQKNVSSSCVPRKYITHKAESCTNQRQSTRLIRSGWKYTPTPRSVDGYRGGGRGNWWTAVFTGIFNLSYIFRADCNSRCNVENWKRTILPITCRWAWIRPLFNGTMTFIEWNILLEISDRWWIILKFCFC